MPSQSRPPRSLPNSGWLSIHIFHRGSIDQLVTEALGPAIRQLYESETLRKYFFLRYWEGGQHLRLRLLPREDRHLNHIRSVVIGQCTRYLRDHPSPQALGTVTADNYATVARRLASAERRTHYDRGLRADDTIEFIDYHPEHAAYGEPPAMTAVETHFSESSTIALRLLDLGLTPGQRHAAALAMLMLTLAVCEPDPIRAATGLRRSAAASVTDAPAWLQDSYQKHHAALRDQALELWARANQPINKSRATAGYLWTWLDSMCKLHRRLCGARAIGRFKPTDSLSPLSHLAPAGPAHDLSVVEVLLRCTHLLFNRLGIHAGEPHIAYLAAHALTDLDQEAEISWNR